MPDFIQTPMTREQISISIECQRRAAHDLTRLSRGELQDWQIRNKISGMPEGFEKDEYRRWLNHYKPIIFGLNKSPKPKATSRHSWRRNKN